RPGDRIGFGAQGGPEVKFEIDNSFGAAGNGHGRAQAPLQVPVPGYGQQPQRQPPPMAASHQPKMAPPPMAPGADAAQLARKAQQAIGEMEKKDKGEAQKLAETGDDLDREIRRILRKFDADTYAVPPIFKERLQFYIEQKTANHKFLKLVHDRKKAYWPMIVK